MIIDAHTHVWPDQIAEKALASNPVPGLSARGDGTLAGLEQDMGDSGVGMSCCLAIANEARHVDRVNEFAASARGGSRAAFGTVHVDLRVEDNLASLRMHEINAVKIHPLFQNYSLEHPRLWELFEAFDDDVLVIAHVGAGGDAYRNSLSSPAMIRAITKQFPKLRLIACHFGGYKLLDDAEELLLGTDIVLETSWPPGLTALRPERVRHLIKKHGAERVVFGSDWPMTSPADEITALQRLGLADSELKSVLGGTMARLLGTRSSWT